MSKPADNTRQATKDKSRDDPHTQPKEEEELGATGTTPPAAAPGQEGINAYPVEDDHPQDDKDGMDFGEFGRGLKLKLPEFWGDQPETWFQQVEAVFWRYGVKTEERKYYLVVCHLPRQVAARVTDALKNPDKLNPYKSLKEHLISAYSVSQFQKDLDLVRYNPGHDQRPSQVLDKMFSLVTEEDKAKPSSLFRSMFFAKLDPVIRDHVVSIPYERFREVALKADEHWFARKSTTFDSVANVNWVKEVEDQESAEGAVDSINVLEEYCYYHRVFGKEAQNCRAPCKFKGKTTSSTKQAKNVSAARRKN